jgi:hypothetical protein
VLASVGVGFVVGDSRAGAVGWMAVWQVRSSLVRA